MFLKISPWFKPFQIDFYFLHLSHGSFFKISKLLGSLNENQRFCPSLVLNENQVKVSYLQIMKNKEN